MIDFESEEVTASHDFPSAIAFMKWKKDSLHVVTKDSVSLLNGSEIVDCCVLPECLSSYQIIDIDSLQGFSWLALSGIRLKDGSISGKIVVLETVNQKVYEYEGFCGKLTVQPPGDTVVFSYFSSEHSSLHIVSLKDASVIQKFPAGMIRTRDFPISVISSKDLNLEYLVMKSGDVHVFELSSEMCIALLKSEDSPLFLNISDTKSEFISINRDGKVSCLKLEKSRFLEYIKKLGLNSLVIRYSHLMNAPLDESLIISEIKRCVDMYDVHGAAVLYSKLNWKDKGQADKFMVQSRVNIYDFLIELSKCRVISAQDLTDLCSGEPKDKIVELVGVLLSEGKIEASEELGDHLCPYDADLAVSLFMRSNCYEKVVKIYVDTGRFSELESYLISLKGEISLESILSLDCPESSKMCILRSIIENGNAKLLEVLDYNFLREYCTFFTTQIAKFAIQNRIGVNEAGLGNLVVRLLGLTDIEAAIECIEHGITCDVHGLKEILEDTGVHWKLCFLAGDDSQKYKIGIDLRDSQDIFWAISHTDTNLSIKILHHLIKTHTVEVYDVYTSFIRAHDVSIDLDEEIQFVKEHGEPQLVPMMVSCVTKLKLHGNQLIFFRELANSSQWHRIEEICYSVDLIDAPAIFDMLSQFDIQSIISLALIGKRFDLRTRFIAHLAKLPVSILYTYLVQVHPESLDDFIEILVDNPQHCLSILLAYEFPEDRVRLINTAEKLLRLKAYDSLIEWLEKNSLPIETCPILSSLYSECILRAGKNPACLKHIKHVERRIINMCLEFNLVHHHLQLMWNLGQIGELSNYIPEITDFDFALNMIFDHNSDSFSVFWNDAKIVVAFFSRVGSNVKTWVERYIKLNGAEILSTIVIYPTAKYLSQHIQDISIDIDCLDEEVKRQLLIFYSVFPSGVLLDRILDSCPETCIVYAIDYLTQNRLYKEAGALSLLSGLTENAITLLDASGAHIEDIVTAVKEQDQMALWKDLGLLLMRRNLWDHVILPDCIINGNIAFDPAYLPYIVENLGSDDSKRILEYFWIKGVKDKILVELLAKIYLETSKHKDLERLISDVDPGVLVPIGGSCYHHGVYDLALEAFIKCKSADWTVICLCEMNRAKECLKFIRLVRNPFVLLYLLDILISNENLIESEGPISLICRLFAFSEYLCKHLVYIFATHGKLRTLQKLAPLKCWTTGSVETFIEQAVSVGLNPNFMEMGNHVKALVKLECWEMVAQYWKLLPIENLILLLENGHRYFTLEMASALAANSVNRVLDYFPEQLVHIANPASLSSYWLRRHIQKTDSNFFLDLKNMIHNNDAQMLRLFSRTQRKNINCNDFEGLETESPELNQLLVPIFMEYKLYSHAIDCLKNSHDYNKMIEVAIASHKRDICRMVLDYFILIENHTMLFVSCMAFYRMIPNDIIIEYAWKSDNISKFAPFICQALCDSN